jgi:hypothetical protein
MYLAAKNEEKQLISQKLIQRIQRKGGRFLKPIIKQDGSVGYREVKDQKTLLKKAAQTLREINDPMLHRSKRKRYREQKKPHFIK